MPRNSLTKEEMKVKVLGLKQNLCQEQRSDYDKELAHKYLNRVLDIIEEYRY